MDMQTKIHEKFVALYGEGGAAYASAGRINLIGEHTDYNNGFVFPGAVEQGIIAEIKPNNTRIVRAYSIDLKDYTEFALDDEKGPSASWLFVMSHMRKRTSRISRKLMSILSLR